MEGLAGNVYERGPGKISLTKKDANWLVESPFKLEASWTVVCVVCAFLLGRGPTALSNSLWHPQLK